MLTRTGWVYIDEVELNRFRMRCNAVKETMCVRGYCYSCHQQLIAQKLQYKLIVSNDVHLRYILLWHDNFN